MCGIKGNMCFVCVVFFFVVCLFLLLFSWSYYFFGV